MIDDVRVLRVCAQLTQGYARGQLPAGAEVSLERMANDADKITAFIGGRRYDKLRAYCAKLVDDAAAREALYVEIDDEIKRTGRWSSPIRPTRSCGLKGYLTHKLK